MNTIDLFKKTLLAATVATSLGLAACSADGDGGDGGSGGGGGGGDSGAIVDDSGTGGNNGGFGPNDGSTTTTIGEDTDGDGKTDAEVSGNFVCEEGAKAYGDVTTEVGTNGLVGGPLTDLLKGLGLSTVTRLLNSVTEPDNVVDGHLATYSTFTLTLGLLGGLLSSVDESVLFPSEVPSGTYAVFGVSFPSAAVDLSLGTKISVTTYLGETEQETKSYSYSDLDLLGLLHDKPAFIGLKSHKAFDRVTIGLTPGLLSVDVGEAIRVHELCTGGKLVTPPTVTPPTT